VMATYWTVRFFVWRTVIDAAALVQRGAARVERRARRVVGGGHRPHPMVRCGACDAVLYDDHSGSVYDCAAECEAAAELLEAAESEER
jgi:hypothetical protein